MEALKAKHKRANRFTASDLLLVTGAASHSCVQTVHSSWDSAHPEQPLLKLTATANEASQGPPGNLWDPCRGKGNRLALLPTCKAHRLVLHATALRFATEQTSATCAAAAAASAWNICCAPRNGCSVALGTPPALSSQHCIPPKETQRPQPNPDSLTPSTPDGHNESDACEDAMCDGTVPPASSSSMDEVQARIEQFE